MSLVKILAPVPSFDPCILLAQQVGLVQVLVAKAAVEAFAQAILPRRTRFDVQHLHADQNQPGLDRAGNKLRAVVAAKSFRHAMHREQFGQRIDRVLARNAAADFDRQALTRVLVDDVQEANRPAVDRRRLNKIPRPNIMREARWLHMTCVRRNAGCPLFTAFLRNFQSGCLPKSVHLLHVQGLPLAPQQLTDLTITPTRPLAHQLQDPLGQTSVFVLRLSLESLARSGLIEYATGSPLRDGILLLKLLDRLASRLRGGQFPLVISFSIEMSKA